MHPILLESLIILALLVLNGVFAMSELAVVTSRRPILEQRARAGSAGAKRALALADEPTRFLSTVQIGITLIGVLAGAFGGATIAESLAAMLARVPATAPYADAIGLAIVVIAVAFVSLIVGELVPKRIAMQAPERVASLMAAPMQLIARIAAPLVTLLTFTTRAVLRVLGMHEVRNVRVTEEEIRAMIAEGRHSGAVHVAEHSMLEAVFRVGDKRVRDVMTQRLDVDWVDIGAGPAALAERFARVQGDTVLACRGSVDDVVGVVRPTRVLARILDGAPLDLSAAAEAPVFVPGTMALLKLIERFQESGHRIAVVLDEHGGVEGTVALDDITRVVMGGVAPFDENTDPAMTPQPDGSWYVDGITDFDLVVERLGLAHLVPPGPAEYRTIGGFVMGHLGHIPRTGEAFTWNGVRFTVVDMDGRRVDKVLVAPPKTTGA